MTEIHREHQADDTDPSLWAGVRDASWYDHPSVHGRKAIHAATSDGFSACDRTILLCEEPVWRPLSSVPPRARCKRSACAKLYDAEKQDTPTDAVVAQVS